MRLWSHLRPPWNPSLTCAKGPACFARTRTISLAARHAASASRNDDGLLGQLFDRPDRHQLPLRSTTPTGLFLNDHVTSPKGLLGFAGDSLREAQRLTDKICVSDRTDARRIVKDFDKLSDVICNVIDMAECIRNCHPDPAFVQAAEQAFAGLYEFMNVLNTHQGLFEAIKSIVENDALYASLSREEQAVARVYHNDFLKSGISLADDKRRTFVELTNRISSVGRAFSNGCGPARSTLSIPEAELSSSKSILRTLGCTPRAGAYHLPTYGAVYYQLMVSLTSDDVKRRLMTENLRSSEAQVGLLDDMLRSKAELARLVGFENFGQLQLHDKMARDPQSVLKFLHSLATTNMAFAQEEIDVLQKTMDRPGGRIEAWTRDRYAAIYTETLRQRSGASAGASASLREYFSVGTVMQGLSKLFSCLYGVTLCPRDPMIGEIWHKSVVPVDVVSERDGIVGVMYCDLFGRPGKTSGASHFTVRCSRRVDEDFDETHPARLAVKEFEPGHVYQLPTIALFCDFQPPSKTRPTFLSFHEVETLFHEFGHAMHSMLGRTAYHNLAGTRCATDFVELPSVLMEQFAKSKDVIPLFARNYYSGEPLDAENPRVQYLLHQHFPAQDTHQQIMYALVDQELHSSRGLEADFSSTKIYQQVYADWGIFHPWPGVSWQAQFSHLHSYGSSYYAYLFDRALAAKVWDVVFAKDPLSRDAGEWYAQSVLRWGGSRDPWESLAEVLHMPELASGGTEAMDQVGRWCVDLQQQA